MADFPENYFMVAQDAVQEWHWTKQQCTIHPIIIYYKDSQEKLAVQSMALFSNDLEHDTAFVYQVQKLLCNYLQLSYSSITNIQYFLDGCSAQY